MISNKNTLMQALYNDDMEAVRAELANGADVNRVSISRLFSSIYRKFNIQGASHLGRHLFVSKLVNSGVNICIVQKLANHKNISTTQHYFNYDPQMLANAVENVRV